jgi:hypothetical protein
MALRRWLTERYLTVDPRALGAGRIVLALVLLLDWVRRARDLDAWYTNAGLLPNHTVLWKPPFEYTFSLFFSASTRAEASVGFALCAAAYVMLLLGVKTRAAQLASLVAVLSLHGRNEFVQNGGDAVLGELVLWTCFLPLGARYSIDALRARSVEASDSKERRAPVEALAMLMLLLQLAVIYGFNALQKTGSTWREGSVVHYMLHQGCNDTWFAVWIRDHLSPLHSKILTWGAWGTEGLLPFLILSPFAQGFTRRAAAALIVGLHSGFALFLNLGIFVPAMLAFTPFLLRPRDYDALDRALARRARVWRRVSEHPAVARSITWLTARAASPAPPGGHWYGRQELWEGLLLVIAVCVGSQILVENSAVTRFKPEWQPRWMNATALYLQSFQGWSMYAPDPPLGDMNLHVDAVTKDGRRVDPWNEVASPGNPRPGKTIPPRLAQNVFYFAYVLRLPWTPPYYQAFEEWILDYPRRTGRKEDALRSFEVFLVEHDSPPPGEREPRNARARSLIKYPR